MGAGVYSQGNPHQVYDGQNVTGTGFFSKYFRFLLSAAFHQCSIFTELSCQTYNRYVSGYSSTKTVLFHHKCKKDSQKTITLDKRGLEKCSISAELNHLICLPNN